MPEFLLQRRRLLLAAAGSLALILLAGRFVLGAGTTTVAPLPPPPPQGAGVTGATGRAGGGGRRRRRAPAGSLPAGAGHPDRGRRRPRGRGHGKADLSMVNLAAPLADGEQVVVPKQGPQGRRRVQAQPGRSCCDHGASTPQYRTLEQLDSLPGIGPVTAQKILDYRTKHGAFTSVDELDAVPGIGPSRMDQLQGPGCAMTRVEPRRTSSQRRSAWAWRSPTWLEARGPRPLRPGQSAAARSPLRVSAGSG